MLKAFLPSVISIGPLDFHLYGFFLGIAAVALASGISSQVGDAVKKIDLVVVGIMGLVGARLIFVLHNLEQLRESYTFILNISDGGLALHGGILGALLGIYLVCRYRDIPFLKLSDALFLYLPAAQAVGRLGNFFNNELYGKPTGLPWGVFIPEENATFHPAFLYEGILNVLNFAVLWKVAKKGGNKGVISAIYLINYGAIRLLLNRIRIDKEYFLGVETSDLYSVVGIVIGLILLLYIRNKGK